MKYSKPRTEILKIYTEYKLILYILHILSLGIIPSSKKLKQFYETSSHDDWNKIYKTLLFNKNLGNIYILHKN